MKSWKSARKTPTQSIPKGIELTCWKGVDMHVCLSTSSPAAARKCSTSSPAHLRFGSSSNTVNEQHPGHASCAGPETSFIFSSSWNILLLVAAFKRRSPFTISDLQRSRCEGLAVIVSVLFAQSSQSLYLDGRLPTVP